MVAVVMMVACMGIPLATSLLFQHREMLTRVPTLLKLKHASVTELATELRRLAVQE